MRDFTIDEWLSEVTGLVSVLTATEWLLLRRLQQLRRETEAARLGQLPVPPLAESLPFDPRPRPRSVDTVPVRREGPTVWLARGWPNIPTAPPAYVSGTPQWASQSQEDWPENPGENAVATSTTRSYDYFAELDEKLAVLHQTGREA
jgi:hypothetical protein